MSFDNRYQTQINLPEIGVNGQNAIENSNVLVIGAGGLGCPVLMYLSALGIGKIGVVDFDVVNVKNLNRQIIYKETDIGKFKVDLVKEKMKEQNSQLEIVTYNVRFSDENALTILEDFDFVIDCCDNYETRYVIDSNCFSTGKPWIYAAVGGFEGQLSVFNYKKKVRYKDVYSDKSIFKTIDACDVQGVVGSTCGFAASLQVNEAIKIILNREDVCEGELLVFNLLDLKLRKFKLNHM
ncbi:MAG: HesA/MoeB/ThiF family protein [Bacteroidetes bacterium]|nr:HesA/MoeB/ThiF family protein [Bacteroidota bacterium]